MGFFRFLISRNFLKHLSIAILLLLLMVFGTFYFLSTFTQHGKEYLVPNYEGLTLREIELSNTDQLFEFVLMDSIFDSKRTKGSVVMQDPPPQSKVKQGRKIYFTIVATIPEMVRMPNLRDLSLRQAITTLENAQLKIKELIYNDSISYKNAVLCQMLQGDTIPADTMLIKGTPITLVLGKGSHNETGPVPFILGKRPGEVRRELLLASFNPGEIIFTDVVDSSKYARLFRTDPEFSKDLKMELGSRIDLYFRSEKNFDFETLIRSYTVDSLSMDSLLIHPDSLQFAMDSISINADELF